MIVEVCVYVHMHMYICVVWAVVCVYLLILWNSVKFFQIQISSLIFTSEGVKLLLLGNMFEFMIYLNMYNAIFWYQVSVDWIDCMQPFLVQVSSCYSLKLAWVNSDSREST